MPATHLPPIVVLCGGLGTRLRGVVADRPKVLAPVGGAPFLDHLLAHLARQGAREVVLATGYRGAAVEAFAGDGARWKLHLRYAPEPERLGTGGALRFAAHAAGLQDDFIGMNGDTFFGGMLARLVVAHEAAPAAPTATLALVEVADAARYGTVESEEAAEDDGKAAVRAVTAFREKEEARTGPGWINAGVYLITPRLLERIPDGPVSLERDVFPGLVGRGLYALPYPTAAFLDIGTPADYRQAEAVLRTLR